MKFAFVTPRYGADIAGGAEHACRLLAEQVARRHDVDVLTTTGRDPTSWSNVYSEGADRVRGVLVRRFAITTPHDRSAERGDLSRRLRDEPRTRPDELAWVQQTGPSSTGLLEHLKRQHRSYDALVFFGLCHPLTVAGVGIAPERSVLFPYAQYRPELRFDLWAETLSSARAVGYFSGSERRLIRSYIGATPLFEEIVGLGIETPPQQTYPRHQQDPADEITDEEARDDEGDEPRDEGYLSGRGVPFRRRHRLYDSFALYGGRIEADNGCEEMLEYFDAFASSEEDMSLVLMGVKMISIPDAPYVRLAGVLPTRERMTAYEAAWLTISPASDDLLSQSLLESLAVGTPVLTSADNAAGVEHCRRANAGLYYANRAEFVEALKLLRTPELRERLGENGRRYIRHHHQWDAVLGRFERLVSKARR